MTLKEFANVDSFYNDIETGEPVPFEQYMRRIINKLDVYQIKRYLPFDIEVIEEKLKEDVNLNNLALKEWDRKADELRYYLVQNGITTHSLSERVCILKEAARMLVGYNHES